MVRTVEERVMAIIARQAVLDPAHLTLDMSPADLGLDSLGLVETIFAIEETFDVSVPFNANQPEASGFDLSSIGAIAANVRTLIDAKT